MGDSPVFESPVFSDGDDELDADDELDGDELEDGDELDGDELEDGDELDAGDDEPAAGSIAGGGRSQAVLEHIVRSLVDEPGAVEIDRRNGRGGPTLSLRVAPGDMGRVIGKRGRIAQALRVVVRAAGARDGSEASVDIVD